jgi:uncharacterized protein
MRRIVLALALVVAISAVAQPAAHAQQQVTDEQLVGWASGALNNYWAATHAAGGRVYYPPSAAWFSESQRLSLACGSGFTKGPFYCPIDDTVYLDREYLRYLRAIAGPGALVVAAAHEWGHHVQHVLGIRHTLGNDISASYELEADCRAGQFFGYAFQAGLADQADVNGAAWAMWSTGDGGMYEGHGMPAQRKAAFDSGIRVQYRVPGYVRCSDLYPA